MNITKTDPSKIYKTLPTPIEFMFNNCYHDESEIEEYKAELQELETKEDSEIEDPEI